MDAGVIMAAGMLLTDEVLAKTKQIIRETLDVKRQIDARDLELDRLEREVRQTEKRVRAAERWPWIPKAPITLRYFDVSGRAQPLRDVLACAGVPFEDLRLSTADWSSRRDDPQIAGPHGSLPTLTWNGQTNRRNTPDRVVSGEPARRTRCAR